MSRKNRSVVAVLLVLVLLLPLTAFASDGRVMETEGDINIFAFNEGENYQKVWAKVEELTQDTLKSKINWSFATDIRQEAALKLAAEEDYDLIFDGYWINMAQNIDDGMYMDLSGYFGNPDYPGLEAAFPPDVVETMRSADGAIYGIPFYDNYCDLRCIYIRGDWREQMGLAEVVDEETFQLFLQAMEENKEELGIVSAFGGGNRGYFYFRKDYYERGNDNIFEVDSTGARATQNFEVLLSDDAKTVLGASIVGDPAEFFADWKAPYNTDYRNQEAIELAELYGPYINEDAITGADIAQKFQSGMYAATEGNLGGYFDYYNKMSAAVPEAKLEVYMYEVPVAAKEPVIMKQAISANFLCVPYYSNDPDRAMSLIDWIFRDQANYDLVRYGIEGEDWEADGEKGYKELTPSNKYLFPTWLICNNPAFSRVATNVPQEIQDFNAWSMDASNFKANPISGFVFNSAPADNPAVTAALTAYRTLQEDFYKNFMIGGYGDDTAAKLEEFYGLAKDNAEIIREELIKQLQAFLDSKQ